MAKGKKETGKSVILEYLKQHLGQWVGNDELRAYANKKGLLLKNDVPRTIRLLRQEGWLIEVKGDGTNRLLAQGKGTSKGSRKGISEKLRYEILTRDNFKCKACGRGADDGVKLQIDHIIPVDWGGSSDLSNLETLCEECNRGKKAWTEGAPKELLKEIMSKDTVESRIESLFDNLPNQDIPSTMIQLVSRGSMDWQRALRRIRQRTGKKILPIKGKIGYSYYKN